MPKVRQQSNILSELSQLEIPDEIRLEANRVYQQLEIPVKRNKNRKRMIFFCIYRAYDNLYQLKDSRSIADLVGLPYNEINKAFSICSKVQTGHSIPIIHKTAAEFIPVILKDLGVELELSDILAVLEEVIEKDKSLKDDFPQTVAAAVICYYLCINGIVFQRKEIAEVTRRSEMTIQKIYKKVSNAHNSC
ncbi:transcription initiation factor TFIIB [Pithovirus sibericum]|uniref:Transcription initiation factor TFIIB n=1 Tax=Pithovirus sibericum TaxID=1450746 RepID=W5S5D6_9VIRU|nr:transcription initiation factor TFIIB [Pithovirus sibericum]AHH01988.1 transcription initiation factor TFIIB [Pithovirus sibericum]